MNEESTADPRFVVRIRNDGFEFDLALHKIYPVLPDASAERSGWIRIVDDSGEDYLYQEKLFHPVRASRELGDELPRDS